jgi:putative (di)nucleoside polyphosphate hydrolase
MKTTCGVFIFDRDGKFLLCHPTGSNEKQFSIPKGLNDPGETYLETAVREVFEETGIVLKPENLKEMPEFYEYKHKNKRLKGFFTFLNKIDFDKLICTSTFLDKGIEWPEIDKYIITSNIRILKSEQFRLYQDIIMDGFKIDIRKI